MSDLRTTAAEKATAAPTAAGNQSAFHLPVAQEVADLGEQLGLGRLGRLDRLLLLAALQELLRRQHEDEVRDGRRDQEGDQGVDEGGPVHRHALGEHDLAAPDAAAAEQLDERVDERVGELLHQGGERGADDDRDGELDDVAAQQEVPEALHGLFSLLHIGDPGDVSSTGQRSES